MPQPASAHATLADWIAREAIPFALDKPESFNAAVDRVVAALGPAVEMLGFGEALHGGEEILVLRNRLFERLVNAHGFSAIAIESSFPKGRVANEYVAERGPGSFEEVRASGFGHGFGRLEANRELVEWMRRYNADPARRVELRFYGFDIPEGNGVYGSPRPVLQFVLDYLASVDPALADEQRRRIEPLLGQDSDWENPAAIFDPTKAVGLSPAATALRIATEDLIAELRTRGPDLSAASDEERYAEALHYAEVTRELLNSHAGLARQAGQAALLGIRDALMADTLAYILARERGRGKVLAFAHNAHLQRGKVRFMLGADLVTWWPAGAHLDATLGPRYAVVASALGASDDNNLGPPEAGTLEARFTAAPGPVRFIPTHRGAGLPAAEIAALPTRSGTAMNPTYQPLTAQSFTDFDWLAVLDSAVYNRGGPPLRRREA